MIKRPRAMAPICAVLIALGGCGTRVPEIQEFPGTTVEGEDLVRAIAQSVQCEMRNAVSYVVAQDRAYSRFNRGVRTAPWFENWGVQVALSLTVEERGGLAPSAVWTPPNPVTALFSLGMGFGVSSTATRISTLNYFYTVRELTARGPCRPDESATAPKGSLLIQSDLQLRPWLISQVLASGTGAISVPGSTDTAIQKDALSHEVKFQVVSSGSLAPAWTLRRFTVNQGGSLLTASRDRTHSLSLTFGPADPGTRTLVGSAASVFLASQIGIAVNNHVRN